MRITHKLCVLSNAPDLSGVSLFVFTFGVSLFVFILGVSLFVFT